MEQEKAKLRIAKERFMAKVLRPLLLTFCFSQLFSALALLGLAIAAIVVGATYAWVGMGIWSGFFGCASASIWAGLTSIPAKRSYGMGLIIVMLAAHVAFFILSFFSASTDFQKLFSSLNAISSYPLVCSSLTMVSWNYLTARLIIDILQILIMLLVMLVDVCLITYGLAVYGLRSFICNALRKDNGCASQTEIVPSDCVADANDLESKAATETSRPKGRNLKKLAKLFLRVMWPVFTLFLVLSLANSAVGIAGIVTVNSSLAIRTPPPIWNVVVAIMLVVSLRMLRKDHPHWHIVMLCALSLGCVGNIVTIGLAIANLRIDWLEIEEMYTETNALSVCSGSATTTTSSPLLSTTPISTTQNNYKLMWRIVLGLCVVVLSTYLTILMAAKILGTACSAKNLQKSRVAKEKQMQMAAADQAPYTDL